jgi:ribose/xylose/arabinose/galactoside ABC-type transport system permease subunit
MNKILGIFGLLIFVCLFTTVMSNSFISEYNLYNITRWSALFGILSIGVAFVIITGGIDLSIGSVVGLVACLLPLMVTEYGFSSPSALFAVMVIAAAIGLLHGVLITWLDLQPFVVTLCGLLFYRGFARWLTDDSTLGFGQAFDDGLRLLAIGKPCSWATMLLLGGIVLLLYGLWRAVTEAKQRVVADEASANRLPGRIRRWSLPAIGLLLAVVGSARFWFGWETAPGAVLFEGFGYRVSGLSVSVSSRSEAMPSVMMKYLGTGLFIPAAIAFLVSAWKVNPRRVLLPFIGVVVSLILLAICVWQLVPMYRQTADDDLWQIGVARLSGGTLQSGLMLAVFAIVAGVVGSIGWLLSSAGSASETAKSLIPLVVATGVMMLLGQTSFAATMVPMPMLIMIGLAVIASIFLNRTVYGRYLLALGRNEEAARYSGIQTKRMIVLAYVLCAMAAGLGGILFSLDVNSVQPSGFGNFYELYAIAAAVLGGCSLRGGEGNILGVVIGAAVMRVLYNAINILGISTKLEFAIIGIVILAGAIVDVIVKRMVAKRAVQACVIGNDSESPARAA